MIRQTEAQNLGRAGERWLESIIPKEWIFQKPAEDIGLDGKVIIGDDRFAGGLEFGVQIKASKKWKIKNGIITLNGISSDTYRFWATRLFPTIIVLYDVTNDKGYYSFLFTALKNPAHLIYIPHHKTISLQFDINFELNKDNWEKIEKSVNTYYSNLVHSLYWVRNTINLFPYISKILKCIEMLHLTYDQPGDNENDKMLRRLGISISHKRIVNTLLEIIEKFSLSRNSPYMINGLINFYIKTVKTFIPDFEKLLNTDSETVVYLINEEKMDEETPKLVQCVIKFLSDLTGENGLDKFHLNKNPNPPF